MLMRRLLVVLIACTGVILAAWFAVAGRERPSHDRTWIDEQDHLPAVRISGDTVRIRNLRDFRHHADAPPDARWIDGAYDLGRLERVWFVLSPFSPRFSGLAHPFLSFEFSDSQFVSLSVEARKEVGEQYSALWGALRRYETMIVIGTEQDLLGLRAVAWNDPIYVYPVAVPTEMARDLFVALLERTRQIEDSAEFYNTITNNCTTNLLRPVNRLASRRVGRLVGLLPGYSFEAAFERGWIDTALTIEEARVAHLMNDRIRTSMAADDFSFRIRSHLGR
ncbi:DUF4105 domain-containing protein [soil metagenome]